MDERVGISEPAYHIVAVGLGTIAGFCTLAGARDPHLPPPDGRGGVLGHHPQRQDHVRAADDHHRAGAGHHGVGNLTGHPHDYRLTVAPWFRSIFYLHPDTALILQAPIGFRLHVLAAWVLIAFWPFSRLVHVFSAPVGYLTRPYIVYRSRDPQLGSRAPRRGWTSPLAGSAVAGSNLLILGHRPLLTGLDNR